MASIPEMLYEPTHNCCSSAVVLILSSPGGACEDARSPALPPLADEQALKGGGTCEDARSPPLLLAAEYPLGLLDDAGFENMAD